MREDDTVARIGGDEFTVLLPEIRHIQDAATVAGKILKALAGPFSLGNHEIFVGTSIGIAFYPFHDDIETLLKSADNAMYHAKEQGGNGYEFYSAEINGASAQSCPWKARCAAPSSATNWYCTTSRRST